MKKIFDIFRRNSISKPYIISDSLLDNAKLYTTPKEIESFEEIEKPYSFFTESDKLQIPKVGTSLNSNIYNNNEYIVGFQKEQKNMFLRLINQNILKHDIIVYRHVNSISDLRDYALEQGYSNEYLSSKIFVYTSLLRNNGLSGKYELIIRIPAGSHYLYTGIYSNMVGANSDKSEEDRRRDNVGEIILNIGSVFQIVKETRRGECTIIEALLVK